MFSGKAWRGDAGRVLRQCQGEGAWDIMARQLKPTGPMRDPGSKIGVGQLDKNAYLICQRTRLQLPGPTSVSSQPSISVPGDPMSFDLLKYWGTCKLMLTHIKTKNR